MTTVAVLINTLVATLHAQWILQQSTLPLGDLGMAIGYDNDSTVYLLSGYHNTDQLTEFSIDTELFDLKGSDILSISTNPNQYGKYYHQLQNIIYIMEIDMYDHDSKYLHIYNMETNQFTENWLAIPSEENYINCITGTEHHLFVIGQTIPQILFLQNNTWITLSTMYQRTSSSCIVEPITNILYVIGGYHSFKDFATIYVLNLTNIMNHISTTWELFDTELSVGCSASRSVLFNESIWVIGGQTQDSNDPYLEIVQIIDPITRSVNVLQHNLSYKVDAVSAIAVGSILYVFGGEIYGSEDNTWMKYDVLPTSDPTVEPTAPIDVPTINPTSRQIATPDPTVIPMIVSTNNPTSKIVSSSEMSMTWEIVIGACCFVVFVAVCMMIFYAIKRRKMEANIVRTTEVGKGNKFQRIIDTNEKCE